MGRPVLPSQEYGTELGGAVQQNTTQPVPAFSDLSAKDQAKLIKTTGQASDPSATARRRHFLGQTGEQPPEQPRQRYPR